GRGRQSGGHRPRPGRHSRHAAAGSGRFRRRASGRAGGRPPVTTVSRTPVMNRVLKVALMCGLAVTVASCGTVRRALPFGLGADDQPRATARAGERASVLAFEHPLERPAAVSGRDFSLPGPQAATAWTQPGGGADNAVEHVIAGQNFAVAWRRDIGAGSSRAYQIMAPVVADNGRVFVLDAESTVSAVDAATEIGR